MSKKASLCAFTVTVMLGGCATSPPDFDSFFRLPMLRTYSSKTCDGAGPCHVDVVFKCVLLDCRYRAEPEELHLANGKNNIKIVWKLPPGNDKFRFCAASGDGVFLKNADHDDGQFNDKRATDKDDGGDASDNDCKKPRNFHWNALNTVARKSYEYKIFFSDKDGRRRAVDPWVYND